MFLCLLCNKDCGNAFNLQQHQASKAHLTKRPLPVNSSCSPIKQIIECSCSKEKPLYVDRGCSPIKWPPAPPPFVETSCSTMKWPPALQLYFAQFNRDAYVAQLRQQNRSKEPVDIDEEVELDEDRPAAKRIHLD